MKDKSTKLKGANRGEGVNSIGLCLKSGYLHEKDEILSVVGWLEARGVDVFLDEVAAGVLNRSGYKISEIADRSDLIVALGGDGTLLALAREMETRDIPILGINMGHLGFLAEIAPEERFDVLEMVLSGSFETVKRMRLDVSAFRGDDDLGSWLALNEAVISRKNDPSRIIDLEASVDGVHVATYRADGLIVSTPTGSTAYSLSAGGPILLPPVQAFVLTPISAHTLSQRPVVLPETTAIEVKVFPREGEAQLTVDGQTYIPLKAGDRVRIARSMHPVRFVASPSRSRFGLLRTKLGWGAD